MKQRFINYVLRYIVKVVIPNDVIYESKGKVFLGKDEITEQEKRSLNAEAKALESMRLWSILNETIKQLSYERGWRDSVNMEQLNTAKIMYHVLHTQQSIVKKFKDMV